MQVVLALLLVVAVVAAWTRICRAIAARQQGRPPREQTVRPRRTARTTLPEGHRPPPGLGPLSPSERFLNAEAARGLRELQLYLADERTV